MTTNAIQHVSQDGSRLRELHAAYSDLKAAADEANARLKVCTDAIKSELSSVNGEAPKIELRAEGLPTLAMTYVERWTLDSKKLKAENPETYVRYARKGGAWTLRTLSGGASE